MEKVKTAMDLVKPILKSESLDEKINRVKRKSESLKAREEDIREELKYAESLWLKKPKREVECWLEHVAQIRDEVRKVEQEVQGAQGSWLPNLQFPAKLDRLMIEVEDLSRKGDFPQGLTLGAQEIRGVTFPTTRLFGQQFKAEKKLIMESLMDSDVLRVGIYGMGGVGKTTLLTHINNELVRTCPNISVAWVTVSQNFRVHKLQDDIARVLNFNFSCDDDEKIRAAKLWNFLERKKNLVLILDDIWEGICLDKVGVYVRAEGCKLILTTRFKEVCRKMDCDKKIVVNPLSQEESWELFMDKLGDDLMLSTPEINKVAKSLVRECAGLPLGIITMARSMKGVDDLFEWRNALECMKESKPGNDDMEIEVFQVLKHSFDMLKDPIMQQCFLNCSLYPEDYQIKREALIEQFICEGLIRGMKSRQAEFDRGHTILNKLVNACLLENSVAKGRHCVKMHDLIRDLALQITSNDPQFLTGSRKGLKSIPEEAWKEDLVKVSLMYNSISEIPSNIHPPKCPKLSILLLNNSGLLTISNNFFVHLKGLTLLDLSFTNIEKLPDSISELVNLSVLLLRGCLNLKYIPSLEKLREMKKLELNGSRMPHGIGNLVHLRHLDLLPDQESIRQMDPTLSHQASVIGVRGRDIIQLRKLQNLYCIIDDEESFNAYTTSLHERGPSYYQLHLGKPVMQYFFTSSMIREFEAYDRTVHLHGWQVRNDVVGFSLFLPKCIEGLSILYSVFKFCLSDEISFRNVINMRSCSISDCRGLKYLFSSSSTSIVQTIETLILARIHGLVGLYMWERGPSLPLRKLTFCSLRKVSVIGCSCMKTLFTNTLLPNLEVIDVRGCNLLAEIASSTNNEGDIDIRNIVTLPKLMELHLITLPSLQSVEAISDVVEIVVVICCPKLRRIPLLDREQCPVSLQHVQIDAASMESLKWDHDNAKDDIQSLPKRIALKKRLTVRNERMQRWKK